MGYRLKHYVIGSSNITEDSEFLTLTKSYYPSDYDTVVALVYSDYSIKVVLYLTLPTRDKYLRSLEIELNGLGSPVIRKDYSGNNYIEVNTTSTEVNSDLSLAGGSQYYGCGIDFSTIPDFISKQFGVYNRISLITQIQDKYYLSDHLAAPTVQHDVVTL